MKTNDTIDSTNATATDDSKPQTITKKDLIERIADDLGMTRASVKRVVHRFLDDIVDELGAENRIEFRDFGVFEVKQRAARTAQNPKTLERVEVPPRLSVKFKPGRRLKDLLEGDRATGDKNSAEIEVKAGIQPRRRRKPVRAPADDVGAGGAADA